MRARGRIRPGLGVIALLSATLTAEAIPAQSPSFSSASDELRERVDYDWTVRELGGRAIELGEFRGRVMFVNAWASWCVPCIREMASIERLAVRLADTDVAFLLVAVERESSVRRHLRRYPLSLPVYLEEQRFPRSFGLRGIPMSWIVDGEGQIVFRHFGAADWDEAQVEAFLRGLSRAGATRLAPDQGYRTSAQPIEETSGRSRQLPAGPP